MSFDLTGRVAIVTGGGNGNGAAIAVGLARAGARVVVADIDPAAAVATAQSIRQQGGEAWSRGTDVSDPAACAALADHVAAEAGPLHIPINNAGILLRGGLDAPDASERWLPAPKVFLVSDHLRDWGGAAGGWRIPGRLMARPIRRGSVGSLPCRS